MKRHFICALIGLVFSLSLLSSIVLAEPDTWTKKADMPTERYGLSTSVVNGKIYAIGGWNVIDNDLKRVEEYDPVSDTWSRNKADMPTARSFLSISAVNGKIYAIGGYDDNGSTLSTVEEYDTGFVDVGIEAKDKLATKWGEIKVYK